MNMQQLALLREVPRRRKRLTFPRVVTEKSAKEFNAELKKLCRSPKPLIIHFDGRGKDERGGETEASLSIYDTIMDCGPDRIYGVVSKAYSGGLVALQACGLRVGRPNSRYLAHFNFRYLLGLKIHAYANIDEWVEEARRQAETAEFMLRKVGERAHKILLDRALAAGKTEEEFLSLLKENRIMVAHEALQWGFIDIVRRR